MTDLDDIDPCRNPAPTQPCTLCDRPFKPDDPWIDWRWGCHDGCGYCGQEGHDSLQPFHVDCVQAMMRFGLSHPYMGDLPHDLLVGDVIPLLWRAMWDPAHVTVADATLARTVYDRCMGERYGDPAYSNPFDVWRLRIFDSRTEFQATLMRPLANCLGLDDREAPYLPRLLRRRPFGGWGFPNRLARMTREEAADMARRMADDPHVSPCRPRRIVRHEPSVWG